MRHKNREPQFLPRKVIKIPNGNVLHGLRKDDDEFRQFGEVYVSKLNRGAVKGWKNHRKATLNLIVTHGIVRFVGLVESQVSDSGVEKCLDLIVGEDNHGLLVVPPGVWLAFGSSGNTEASIVNVSTEIHDPIEAETADFQRFGKYWTD